MSDRIAVMNAGHYEQLGDPETLYERPTTRFVAGFLGVSNLLTGDRLPDEDGFAVAKVVGGNSIRLPLHRLDGVDDFEIGVRPEKIRLASVGAEPPAGFNSLVGRVIDASYVGVSTQYIVRVDDRADVTVYEQNSERTEAGSLHKPGETVVLAWSPDHTFVVRGSQQPAVGAAA